jgi:hypothetical protein
MFIKDVLLEELDNSLRPTISPPLFYHFSVAGGAQLDKGARIP